MPNIASVLKSEIARVARKEVRAETDSLKKASSQYRSDIAALKRQLASTERELKKLRKALSTGGSARGTAAESAEEAGKAFRFSAKGLAAQRQRLGLSAAQVAQILGVSGQSIYKWETGAARPRASQFAAIGALRGMGKREALAKLAA